MLSTNVSQFPCTFFSSRIMLWNYAFLFSCPFKMPALLKSRGHIWLGPASSLLVITLRWLSMDTSHFQDSVTSTSSTSFPLGFRIRSKLTILSFLFSTLWVKKLPEIAASFSHMVSTVKTGNLLGLKVSHWPSLISWMRMKIAQFLPLEFSSGQIY